MADYKKQGSQGCTCGNMPANDHGIQKDSFSKKSSSSNEALSDCKAHNDSIERKAIK